MLKELEPKSVSNEPKSQINSKPLPPTSSITKSSSGTLLPGSQICPAQEKAKECGAPRGQPFLVFPEPLNHSFQCHSLLQFSKVTFRCQQADGKICLSLVTLPGEKFLTLAFVPH